VACGYDSQMPLNIFCLTCAVGYANPAAPYWNNGTCQSCGPNCLGCLAVAGYGCGPNATTTNCGTNGMRCTQCATGYYLALNGNCYDCPTSSANCNTNSCSLVSPGVVTCNSCANNSYTTPMTINGANYTVNGSVVWICLLCSAGGSNCLTCTYDPLLVSNMVCQSCVAGYAVSLASGSNYGTCQPCQSYCLACQYNSGSGCGASIPSSSCGTNGMMCTQCAANYTLGIDANCYYCPTVSTNCLVNSCS